MKKTCLTLLAALAICLSANAQKVYTQKVYTGSVAFSDSKKGYKIVVDNAKTIAEKKAGKKYIVSVLKKFYGNDFLKEGIDHVDVKFLTYCVDDYDIKWLKSEVKPQYLKKGNLLVYIVTNYNVERDEYLAIYNTKTGKVYSYDEIAYKP